MPPCHACPPLSDITSGGSFMTVAVAPRTEAAADARLEVQRTDIVFRNETPHLVRIEISVANSGDEPSEPTLALVQAAPLGAFASWQSLTALRVPAIAPGESAALDTAVPAPR